MASSSTDVHSQPKRPPAMARQSSESSQVSQSPSEGGHHKNTLHQTKRQHLVGTARVQRNASAGKNLNKLNKAAQALAGDGNATKHHRRTKSGDTSSVPSSPRPGFKRNASSGGIVRGANHTHTHSALRKNHSSGHLARLGSSKNIAKSSKSEVAPAKKLLLQPAKPMQSSVEDHPTVHFDVGDVDDEDDEEHDDGWTEESASQSPTTTRSNTRANTRSNSVVLDINKPTEEPVDNAGDSSNSEGNSSEIHLLPSAPTQPLPDRTNSSRQLNGSSVHHSHSRPPDADMITSKLLQRSSSHNPPPQMSTIAATVASNAREARDRSRSAASTLVDTPGRDLVSRFMDGDGSAGTPKDASSFLPSRDSPPTEGGELDNSKRNKSMPNVAGTGASTPSRPHSRRSGTSTPTDLPPSRTQQKLMLQRASSHIEPQKLVPVILPRTGGPTFTSGMTYTANGEGRLDPRLQQQFNHVTIEYKVVRRYRNPLADSLVRIEQTPGTPRKARVPKSAGTNGFASAHGSNSHSLSTSFNENVETDGSSVRRSRVSFDRGPASRDEADMEGRQSFESENERVRNEAEEICRRLWESTEVVEGD
jgi:hypothetical protein